MKDIDVISGAVVDAAVRLHRRIGPGLLESVYQKLLVRELDRRNLRNVSQVHVPFTVDGLEFGTGLRVDLLVEDSLVVELKSVEKMAPVHWKQVLTYIRLLDLPVGLLLNFGGATMQEGIVRVVNRHRPSAESPLRVNRAK